LRILMMCSATDNKAIIDAPIFGGRNHNGCLSCTLYCYCVHAALYIFPHKLKPVLYKPWPRKQQQCTALSLRLYSNETSEWRTYGVATTSTMHHDLQGLLRVTQYWC
jgi:hypothetical protein